MVVVAQEQYTVRHYSIENGMSQNTVMTILQDKQGYMWFGTWDGLNRLDGYNFKVYKAMENGQPAKVNNRVDLIWEDEKEQLWWLTYDGHYYMLDKSRTHTYPKPYNELPEGMKKKIAESSEMLHVDSKGILWQIDEEQGVVRSKGNDHKRLTPELDKRYAGQLREHFLVLEDRYGRTWVNPNGGGWGYYDEDKDQLVNPFRELSNMIHTAYIDREGQMWIATYDGGVECVNMDPKPYRLHDLRSEHTSSGEVRAMIELQSGEIKTYTKGQSMVYCALESQHGLLCGTKGKGIINLTTGQTIKTSDTDVYDIIESEDGTLYVATYGGGVNIITYDKETRRYADPKVVGNKLNVRDLELVGNTLWCGTTTGIVRISLKDYSMELIPFYDVRDLCYSHGKLWIGTFGGGLNQLDPTDPTHTITHIRTYSDIVLSMVCAGDNIWFTSENDITQYNPKTDEVYYYDVLLGERGSYFTEAEAICTREGELLFGYSNGYCSLDPKRATHTKSIPPMKITRCISQDKELQGDTIHIAYGANLTIEYAALLYSGQNRILYAYRMDNVDKGWNYVNNERRVTYSNLKYGTYTFHVYSHNREGIRVPNETTLCVIVDRPMWLSWWAVSLMVLVLGILVYVSINVGVTYSRMRSKIKVDQEVTDIKLRFFTNISHELRTPLTLITGPVENILQTERINPSVRAQLEIVQANSLRMLRLVNQLLDFRKIQKQKMRLKVQQSCLSELAEETCSNFRKEAEDKHITLTLDNRATDSTVWIDRARIDTVLYNLLSNAFKFTPSGKQIRVIIDEKPGYVLLQVADQGIGIPMEKRSVLFERFSSNNQLNTTEGGTGIGMNLVKELIDLHHGYIEVESEVGQGTTFTIMLKTGKEHYDQEAEFVLDDRSLRPEASQHDKPAAHDTATSTHARTILVVDDNEDMRTFLTNILAPNYNIQTAGDGEEAWLMITTGKAPDLIVSDLMMPKLDGLELTQRIKSSTDTNYIPLILLTAKSAIESRLQAMNYGADDYVTKPFEPEYLKARIHNILTQREQLEARYRERLLRLEPQTGDETVPNDTFLAKLMEIMEKNMDNNELKVDDVVDEIGVGRTVFFNKLKGLTGLSPVEFIREVRVKRAAQLLDQGNHNITEITYMVGMNDSRYFSKCFKATFGMTPSEYKRAKKSEPK